MRDYELRDLQTNLKVALAEAVMSRIVVTDREAGAFQTVLNVLSKLPTETTPPMHFPSDIVSMIEGEKEEK